ncbi:MAG: methyltransferase domain-containing protein [Anaerolineae bacterium]
MASYSIEDSRVRVSPPRRARLRQYVRRLSRPAWLGTLRQTHPLSDAWGYDRGTPVDRYYIEQFLADHRDDMRGHVLEVKDSGYTDRLSRGVERVDVLDVDASNPRATLIADLAACDAIEADQFDCFVLTQTLQFIYDTRAAIGHTHRILRPGGVVLATVPSVSRLDRRMPDYWRFTADSCAALFGETFGPQNVTVRAYGNMLTAIAFLAGMACEELSRAEMETQDRQYPLVIGVRAVKGAQGEGERR